MFSIDFSSLSGKQIHALAIEGLPAAEDAWENKIWEFLKVWYSSPDEPITVFSSGSTGTPRAINHTRQAMLLSAAATCHALQLKQGSSALLCLPADKISGMMMLVRSLYNKMRLYCVKTSISVLNELPTNVKIDFAAFTPTQFSAIVEDEIWYYRMAAISKIILGGEGIQPALMDRIKTLPNEVYATFGMTETISHIALKRLNGAKPDRHFKALPGVTLSVDERSCLVIKAPGIVPNSLVTNDIIELISGAEFNWLGRADNVINSGGIKIYPEQLEAFLSPLVNVSFFIAGVPDAKFGQKPVLVVEGAQLSEHDRVEITNALQQLPKHQQPKEIMLIPHFVRTGNGKLKRVQSLEGRAERIAL